MDRGAWLATVHGVAKIWTRLKHTHTIHEPIYINIYIYMYIAVLKIISNTIIYFIKPLHGNKDNLGV